MWTLKLQYGPAENTGNQSSTSFHTSRGCFSFCFHYTDLRTLTNFFSFPRKKLSVFLAKVSALYKKKQVHSIWRTVVTQTEGEKKKKEGMNPDLPFHSPNAAKLELSQAKARNSIKVYHVGDPSTCSGFHCCCRSDSSELNWKCHKATSDRGCRCCRHWVNLWHHSTGLSSNFSKFGVSWKL